MNVRESLLDKIIEILTFLKTMVSLRNSLNFYDANINAEYFYSELLNLIYGSKLTNLNSETKNAGYVDLIDRDAKYAIQVTSQNDNSKIKKTIEGFYAQPEYENYKLRLMLIAKDAKDYHTDFTVGGKYTFDHKKDVLDIARLLAKIRDLNTEHIKEIAQFLEGEVRMGPEAQPPGKRKSFCYVIVSTKKKVLANVEAAKIEDDCMYLFEGDRYHDSDNKQWKPFDTGETIWKILTDFKDGSGIEFDENYLDEKVDDEKLKEIQREKNSSIAIIDLLSLSIQNERIALRFDDYSVPGVLLPIPLDLSGHKGLYEYIIKRRQEVFPYLRSRAILPCYFYGNINEIETFLTHLSNSFHSISPICNTVDSTENVRGKVGNNY